MGWYAKYRKSDKVVTTVGFFDPKDFEEEEYDIAGPFEGDIPDPEEIFEQEKTEEVEKPPIVTNTRFRIKEASPRDGKRGKREFKKYSTKKKV